MAIYNKVIHLNNFSKLLTNTPYKLVNHKLFEISELCEGHIINFSKNKVIKPKTIEVKSTSHQNNYYNIPISIATINNIEYFNCKLVKYMDIFILENNKSLNKKNYVNFVDKQFYNCNKIIYANNFRLKINNYPNFIMPSNINSKGIIILGKYVNDYNIIELASFQIPINCGIYISPNSLFDDRYLFGNWKCTE